MSNLDTNTETDAIDLQIGDKLFDPIKAGTHQSRVEVQWLGHHLGRRRTYVAGVEERSGNPVTLAYDNIDKVKVYRS